MILLLAQALASEPTVSHERAFDWVPRDMGAPQVDLRDKERLYAILEPSKRL